MREKITLSKLVQMVPHLLIGGPERQNRICREIKIAWMPGLGKPGRVKPTHLQSSKILWNWGHQIPWRKGLATWIPLLPTPPVQLGKSLCPIQRRQEIVSLQKVNQGLAGVRELSLSGAEVRLLTEKVGNMRKSAHGVMRPQPPSPYRMRSPGGQQKVPLQRNSLTLWVHHQETTRPQTPNTQFHFYDVKCIEV